MVDKCKRKKQQKKNIHTSPHWSCGDVVVSGRYRPQSSLIQNSDVNSCERGKFFYILPELAIIMRANLSLSSLPFFFLLHWCTRPLWAFLAPTLGGILFLLCRRHTHCSNMVSTSLFWVNLSCRIFRTLRWHHVSSMSVVVFFGFPLYWHLAEFFLSVKWNGYVYYKMSPQPLSTSGWLLNGCNFSFRWTIPLNRKF